MIEAESDSEENCDEDSIEEESKISFDTFQSKIFAPSRAMINDSLIELGYPTQINQEAFCSREEDVPNKGKIDLIFRLPSYRS